MTSNTRILDTFLNFFQCGGLQFTDEHEGAVIQKVLEPERPHGSSSTTSSPTSSPTSIYSIPSRESMTEIRQKSMNRFSRSPLFACTSSSPMKFSWEDSSITEYELEKRDDSTRTISVRTEGREFSPIKSVNSIATVTTADSASVVDEEDLQVQYSEDSPEYQVDVVAVRE